MTDEEWSRICKRASITHALAAAALIMVPFTVTIQAPEFAARFNAWLISMPDIVQLVVYYAWFVCFIGCFFPPRRIFGRGVWAVLAAGMFGLEMWACATDVINDAGEIPSLGATGSTVVSVVWVLLFGLCVAGIIFDGPKRWERRYSQRNTGEIARR